MPSGGGGGDGGAEAARKREEERQAQIREARRRINAIFDGGTYGGQQVTAEKPEASDLNFAPAHGGGFRSSNAYYPSGEGDLKYANAYDPDQTYYNADGEEVTFQSEPEQDRRGFGMGTSLRAGGAHPGESGGGRDPGSSASVFGTVAPGAEGGRRGTGSAGADRGFGSPYSRRDPGSPASALGSMMPEAEGGKRGMGPPSLQRGSGMGPPSLQRGFRQPEGPYVPDRFKSMVDEGNLYTEPPKESDGAFGPDYYNQYKQDYLDYYTPQIQDRYQDAQEEITHQLADRGVLESSIANERFGNLREKYGQRRGEVQNKAENAVAERRANVEEARTSLFNLAQSSADPSLAAQQAQARVSTLQNPPEFSPIGNVFADLVQKGGRAIAAERQGYRGTGTELFSQPVGGSGSGSVKVRS